MAPPAVSFFSLLTLHPRCSCSCPHATTLGLCQPHEKASPEGNTAYGLVHAWVGQIVLKCDDFKTLFAEWPIARSGASLTLLQVTADLPLLYGCMLASDGRAAIAFSSAGASVCEAEASPERRL